MQKYQIGDTFTIAGIECTIVSTARFGGVWHYGINYSEEGKFLRTAAWMPFTIVDALDL